MIVFDINITVGGPRSVSKRSWPKIKKEVYLGAARYWHAQIKNKHFTKAGGREYNYTPRSGERGSGAKGRFFSTYTGRKQRKFGHTNPLVWAGRFKAEAQQAIVKGTSKGSAAVIRGRVLNVRLRNSRINMREEITAVSDGDSKAVVSNAQKDTNQQISKAKLTRKRIKV